MADTAVPITAGTGTNIDTRTESTNSNHRQVVVIGDPSLNAGVAAVKDASTAPLATDPALVVSISPNCVNANGQTTMAASAPVVLASDQSWPVSTTGFMKKEDVASADGDAGIPAMAVRKATPADLSGTDGDWEFLQVKGGRLWGSSQTYGDVAHDSADASPPVKGGHKATTSLAGLTLVASADVTDSFAGIDGVQIVRPHCNLEDIVTGNATNTDGTSTQCIAAQAAGIKMYLVSVVLANTSATAITVDIKDGSTVKTSLPLPAGSGCVYNPPVPIPGTAATAWNFDGSAAATTVTCSMVGFKSKV